MFDYRKIDYKSLLSFNTGSGSGSESGDWTLVLIVADVEDHSRFFLYWLCSVIECSVREWLAENLWISLFIAGSWCLRRVSWIVWTWVCLFYFSCGCPLVMISSLWLTVMDSSTSIGRDGCYLSYAVWVSGCELRLSLIGGDPLGILYWLMFFEVSGLVTGSFSEYWLVSALCSDWSLPLICLGWHHRGQLASIGLSWLVLGRHWLAPLVLKDRDSLRIMAAWFISRSESIWIHFGAGSYFINAWVTCNAHINVALFHLCWNSTFHLLERLRAVYFDFSSWEESLHFMTCLCVIWVVCYPYSWVLKRLYCFGLWWLYWCTIFDRWLYYGGSASSAGIWSFGKWEELYCPYKC